MLTGLNWLEKIMAVGVPLLAVAAGVLGVSTLIWWVLRRIRHQPSPSRRWRRIVERTAVVLLGLELVGGLYAWRVEPYWPEVTMERIAAQQLPGGTEPFRLVHISDTHCDGTVRLEADLPERIAALEPDAIVFTGDAVNSMDGLKNFRALMRALADIAPVYAVAGNWDGYLRLSPREIFEGTGVRLLAGEAVPINGADGALWVAGSADRDVAGLISAVRDVPPEAVAIAAYHRPDAIYEAAGAGADVYLCGHTHGGQVALPLYGPLVTLSRYGRRFGRGRHRVNGTVLMVSRGIGMEGRRAPRVRFCARPQIGVVEIVPSAPGN